MNTERISILFALLSVFAGQLLSQSAPTQPGQLPKTASKAPEAPKDPAASDVLYIKALAAPFTVNTMPEATLKALADHGELGSIMGADGGNCEEVIGEFAKQENYDLIVHEGVMYAGPKIDITKKILEKLGKK